ncbi:MAG: hypothetical protein U1A72_19575 [Sulfuritalea sp.]|nr:hypothetical protein [Sulfuritalea sp.]
MKPIRQSLILVMVAFAGLSLSVGCSSKPSNSEVQEAVKSAFQGVVIWALERSPGGVNAKISTVEIKEWGAFNEERKDWPVKIRVVGSADFSGHPDRIEVKQFDAVSEFRFRKDDYGKWRVTSQIIGDQYMGRKKQ